MDLLSLLSGGDFAGANGPDWLVSNDDLAPVLDGLGDGSKLANDDLGGLVRLALLEGLTAAENHADAAVNGSLGLAGDKVVALLQDGAALAVAQQGPGDVGVLELVDADLAGEGAVGLVEDVLGGDLDAGAQVLASEEEVEGGWGDDDLGVGVALGVVEVLDNSLDRLNGAVPVLRG